MVFKDAHLDNKPVKKKESDYKNDNSGYFQRGERELCLCLEDWQVKCG